MGNKPLVTIVTVVYNGKEEIEETIRSVIEQTYDNIEYIVIDGGSSDGTQDLIKEYEDKVDYWISEPDQGIYDAMNKGIELANGDFIEFLNAGDALYANDTIEKVVARIQDKDAVYFGRAYTYDEETSWLYPSKERDGMENDLKKGKFPNHQAMFFPKKFYKNCMYDLRYKITSDIDYKLRAYLQYPYLFIDEIVVTFALGGISTQNENYKAVKQKIKENFHRDLRYGHYVKLVRTPIMLTLKYLLAKLLGKHFNKALRKIKGYRHD